MKGRKFSFSALLLIGVINFYFLITVRICDHQGTNWQTIIYSDGKGYYEYLRAAFINHDLGKEDSSLGFIRMANKKPVIKFFAGPAIAYSPFFAIAYVHARWNDNVKDGYSIEFQRMIAIAGWFYCLLGLFFIEKLLRIFSFPDLARGVTLLLITYGTNLFYYAVLEPSMSHVYAFGCIAGFIFCSHQYFKAHHLKYLILASVFFGLTIIIRPTNVLVLFMIPFLAGKRENFLLFLKNFRHVFLSALIVATFVFVQLLFWKLQSGNWIVWSYAGEGFYFTRPAIAGVLFSYDKGWFVYTPLAAVAMVGIFPLWKVNRNAAVSIALTLGAAVYVTASWWCWDYANAFGMRPMIDFYALVAVLLAALLASFKKNLFRIFTGILLAFLFALSILQTYQYYHGILQHYGMNKGKYWYIFMKTGDAYKNILGGSMDLMPYTKKSPLLIHDGKYNFENGQANWSQENVVNDPLDAANQCFHFDSNSASLVYSIHADTSIHNSDMLYFEVSLRRMELAKHSSSSAKLAVQLRNGPAPVLYHEFMLNDFPDDKVMNWRTYHHTFRIRKQYRPYDTFVFEVLNSAKQDFLVDDVEIKVYRMFQR